MIHPLYVKHPYLDLLHPLFRSDKMIHFNSSSSTNSEKRLQEPTLDLLLVLMQSYKEIELSPSIMVPIMCVWQ